jgi:hypothetical protein
MRLAIEEKKTPDDSLPDPSEVGFSASDTEMIYNLWVVWRALGKPPNISMLIKELIDYEGVIGGLLEMESLYARVQRQFESQNPKK